MNGKESFDVYFSHNNIIFITMKSSKGKSELKKTLS